MYIQINHLSKLRTFTTFLSTAEALLVRHNDFSSMHPDGQKAQFYAFNRKVTGNVFFPSKSHLPAHYHI